MVIAPPPWPPPSPSPFFHQPSCYTRAPCMYVHASGQSWSAVMTMITNEATATKHCYMDIFTLTSDGSNNQHLMNNKRTRRDRKTRTRRPPPARHAHPPSRPPTQARSRRADCVLERGGVRGPWPPCDRDTQSPWALRISRVPICAWTCSTRPCTPRTPSTSGPLPRPNQSHVARRPCYRWSGGGYRCWNSRYWTNHRRRCFRKPRSHRFSVPR